MKKAFEFMAQIIVASITIFAMMYAMGIFIDTWIYEDTQRCVSTMQELGKDTKPCY